jgi:hypothetical protein
MQYSIDTKRQYEIIKNTLGAETIALLKDYKGFLAGGAISSLFTGRPVRDWDVFFPMPLLVDESDLKQRGWSSEFQSMMTMTYNKEMELPREDIDYDYAHTKVKNNVQLQLVHAFHGNPLSVFQSFDFHCCMGAYSFETEEFIFDPFFITDNMNRQLRFNFEGAANPIHAAFRVEKYKKYGYTISTTEMLKMLLAIKRMKLDTLGDFRQHVKTLPQGIYKKVLIDELYMKPLAKKKIFFKTPEGKQQYAEFMKQPFDFETCVNILSDINAFVEPKPVIADISLSQLLSSVV